MDLEKITKDIYKGITGKEFPYPIEFSKKSKTVWGYVNVKSNEDGSETINKLVYNSILLQSTKKYKK